RRIVIDHYNLPVNMKKSPSPHRPRSIAPIPYVAGVDYDVLDDLLGYSLRRAQVAMFLAFHAATRGLDITPPRFTALCVIGANPGLGQSVLGEVLGIARSGAMLLVDWMEARGYVERRRRPDDARAWGLHLTAAGEKFVRALKKSVVAEDHARAGRLTPAERRELLRLLAKLAG
ncbi:MAG: MarR family winged helix-turn-helix transcriptional regulator, partial [Burkholderiales bacterium]